MKMEPSLNRRQLLRAAAGTLAVATGGAFMLSPAHAQTADASSAAPSNGAPDAISPSKQPSGEISPDPAASASDKDTAKTAEGAALADAALAGAGHALPSDSEAEVRKQLGSYPASFEKARKFSLANGDAPRFGVTSPLT